MSCDYSFSSWLYKSSRWLVERTAFVLQSRKTARDRNPKVPSSSPAMAEDLISKISDVVGNDLCEKILRKSENDPSIKVTNVGIKPATNKGDNYTSDMFRASVDFERCRDGKKSTDKKSLIIKVEPMTEGVHKKLIAKSSLFKTEINMMTDTLAKMNEVLGPGHQLNGRGLFTQKEPPLLVIEDLAPLGFRMADRQAGLDIDHCLLAIRGLARFHGSSVAVCEKDPSIKKQYYCGMFHKDQPEEFRVFFNQGARQLGQEAANWPELDPKYAKKISKIAEQLHEKGCAASVYKENEFNVINHGDFWVNNMLFKYDKNGKPCEHIFVDFQLCLYCSPAYDLQYFFNTSLNDDTLLENEERLLTEYLKTLGETMAKAGCRTEPPTLSELKAMMRERALYGMIASFSVLPIMLVDKEEAKDLGEIMNNGDYDNPCYKGKHFRKAMLRRLPKFDEMGLLD